MATRCVYYSVKEKGSSKKWIPGFQFWHQGSACACRDAFNEHVACGDASYDCGFNGKPIDVRIDETVVTEEW